MEVLKNRGNRAATARGLRHASGAVMTHEVADFIDSRQAQQRHMRRASWAAHSQPDHQSSVCGCQIST